MPQTEIRVYRTKGNEQPLVEWLSMLEARFPKAYKKCLAAIRELASKGNELRRPLAEYLQDGIYELRVRDRRVNYRMLYAFNGKNIVVLTHGFTKEGRVPPAHIETAVQIMKSVRHEPNKHTVEFEY